MAKQPVSINFGGALDTKTDPFQLETGKFSSLINMVRTKGGLLTKRPGYGLLNATSPTGNYLTTLNDNLTLIGKTVSAYSQNLSKWITKGNLQPCSLNVLPLIRNNLNQTQADCAIAGGLVLTVFSQINSGTTNYLYAIADATTGQNIVQPSSLPVISGGTISGSSRAYVVGSYFVIVSPVTVSSTTFLQYVSIPFNNPVNTTTNSPNISVAQNVTSEIYSAVSANPGWDAVAVNSSSNNTLVVAYNSITGAQGVHVATLTVSQIALAQSSNTIQPYNATGYIGAIVSICVDLTVSPNIFYVTFWNTASTTGYTFAFYIGLGTITTKFAPVVTMAGTTACVNIGMAAQNGVCTIFNEVTNAYSYDSAIPSNFINGQTITSSGSVGTPYVAVRSVGLASKPFLVNGSIYFNAVYVSPYQPTYFLMNGSLTTSAAPIVVAKLAYQNAGGYVALGLPNVTLTNGIAQLPYFYKDDVEALTTLNNTQQTTTGGIYSQTGINLASFNTQTTAISAVEIAGGLQISGGFLAQYDGYLPVEQNFFLFPDSVEATWSTTGGSVAAQPDGSTNTKAYAYQAVYEWTDNQGIAHRSTPSIPIFVTTTGTGTTGSITVNVPYLRLTQKISNPVKIVLYRWSAFNQVYQQVTSITAPKLNITTSDSIAIVDTLADASILGNNFIYTTGGVVPDYSAPATNILTLFDTRVWQVLAEDPNTLAVSKQVIKGTPVEMSSLFTIYVAPNLGTTASTGPMTGLAPMDDKLIIFKKNAIYYINGTGPDNLGNTSVGCSLGNYSQPTFITSVVGCTNQNSIVLTNAGLMFQSDKGIWLLPSSLREPTYVGAPVEAFNSLTVTSAKIIPQTNYVVFTLSNNQMLMYDYFYNDWGEFQGPYAVASCIYQNLHTLIDKYGNVLQQTPTAYLDNQNPVNLKFRTGWFNLASLQGYQRLYDFYFLAKFLSPHSLLVQIAYDYNPSIVHETIITPQNYSSPTPGPFGTPTPFGSPANVEQWRIHSKIQLCQSFQITITEVFNPAYATVAGAGFTMSGITMNVEVKKATRPISGGLTSGVS